MHEDRLITLHLLADQILLKYTFHKLITLVYSKFKLNFSLFYMIFGYALKTDASNNIIMELTLAPKMLSNY